MEFPVLRLSNARGLHWCEGVNQYSTRVAQFRRSTDSGVANRKSLGDL